MRKDQGTISAGRAVLFVQRVALENAELVIEAQTDGHYTPTYTGLVTIFGRDGQGFGQSARDVVLPEVAEGSFYTLTIRIRMTNLT